MPDFRVHCPAPSETAPATLRLSAEESHHLVVVNRATAGAAVVAFDGCGREWTCRLETASKREAVLVVQSTRQAAPLGCAITLAQALPKGGVMDDIVRHATELGVAKIIPLVSARTQLHLEGDRSDKKIEKWRTHALEACKQCGNPWLPEIAAARTFAEWSAEHSAAIAGSSEDAAVPSRAADADELRLVASLHPGAVSFKAALAAFRTASGCEPRRVTWLIGPEGDLTPDEVKHAIEQLGFRPVTFGPLVLRCDTAATYALAATRHELG